ncbi:hypothetical protein LAZ40_15365 [Cereibacter sphaeroides]|uniref:hypothetical protein n=1 Tax=Cereibacter sphaeroides TaxID=1063 RepID=UPI001F44FFA6|nr:hypothetical protein [Cereibacter sphaeroides]MCE6960402.1 hypothetical protein [Cereibacter sphaeroides]MCE6969352.1 hypothetical protein [Cereibacter sphaeroides]MCE6975410.1 hypothetical protein [Cereibacter sphaeroides]
MTAATGLKWCGYLRPEGGMSERMTNVEYGDVLSSIRRLVEEEAAAHPIEAACDAAPGASDPLVLTPALRVVTRAQEPDAAAPFIEVTEDWLADEAPAGPGVLHSASVLSFSARAGEGPRNEDPVTDAAAAVEEIDAEPVEAAPAVAFPDPLPEALGMIIDEDRLREIVREILREELQGAMGERITRNIRKLVRAEIHRDALTRALD